MTTDTKAPGLREALEFYADPRRYEGPNQRPIAGDKFALPNDAYLRDVTRDGGHIARRALATPPAPTPSASRAELRNNVLRIVNGIFGLCIGVYAGEHQDNSIRRAVDAILALLPDAAAIRAAAFEEAAKIVTARVEGMELQRFVYNGVVSTDTRGNDLFIAKADVEKLLTERAAAIRAAGEK